MRRVIERKVFRELKWYVDAASNGFVGVADERDLVDRLTRELSVSRKTVQRSVHALMEQLNAQGMLRRFSDARPYMYYIDAAALRERMAT